jgi:hypothetical protein
MSKDIKTIGNKTITPIKNKMKAYGFDYNNAF